MDIDWTSIDIIMFDMDGTLLDLAFDNRFWLQRVPQVYADLHSLSLEDSLQQLKQRFNARQGQLAWYCLDFWSQELGIDLAKLKQDERHFISLRPQSLDFLQRLQISGHAAWLVTNAHHLSLSLKLDTTGIGNYFQHIICSHSYSLPKESPDFWAALLEHHPHNPARCLLIDDSEAVLDAAQHAGIGQLLTIAQPDMQQPHRSQLRYPAIKNFTEVFPLPGVIAS